MVRRATINASRSGRLEYAVLSWNRYSRAKSGSDASDGSDAGEDAGNEAAKDASKEGEVSDGAIQDAADEGDVLHCPPVCGIVVHP